MKGNRYFNGVSSFLFVWFISHQPTLFFSQNKPATNNQPTVLFAQTKSALATSQTNRPKGEGNVAMIPEC
jgi:hypothetical protein